MKWVLLLALFVTACGGGDDDAGVASTTSTIRPPTTSAPDDPPPTPLGELSLTLTEVATLDGALALAIRPGTDGFYVAGKGGLVHHVAAPGAEPEEVLDLSDDVSRGGEQGLLGLAFSPDGGRMYVSYTDREGDTRIDEHTLATGATREVFAHDQPFRNHNGGNIAFGPDGLLWFGLGDGGAGGDPDANAQNPDTLLGKLIRFDPADPADPEPEIYALGLRNPWRFSFDRQTGDLRIGDVGQSDREEIDFVPAGTEPGVNLGWDLLEGTQPFDADEAPGTVLPVFEYGRDEGQSVVGGYVYRGEANPELRGTYLFADTYTAELRALRLTADGVDERALGIEVPGGLVSSFAEDAAGELYVLSLSGGVYRIDA